MGKSVEMRTLALAVIRDHPPKVRAYCHSLVAGSSMIFQSNIEPIKSGAQFGTQKCAERAVEAVDALSAVGIY